MGLLDVYSGMTLLAVSKTVLTSSPSTLGHWEGHPDPKALQPEAEPSCEA